ncbi:MAG: pro-sigmaK processing inhibitor BofA family protein [Oscillospiraceae bacterium]|nr:pro-sigmaK processing inhibitor BofA family protein [Oscillospiraceae bacterium]
MNAEDIVQGVEFVAANPWVIAAAVAALLVIFFIIFKASLKLAAKVLINAVVGFVLLFVFNGIGSLFGIALEISWFNAIISGVLGIPGVALLLILKWMGIM